MSLRIPLPTPQGNDSIRTSYYHPDFNTNASYTPETVITNWQSGHGWTKFSAAGTQQDDSTNYIRGLQSMQQTTDGIGSTIQSRKTITSTDLTGKMLVVQFMVSDITKLSSVRVRASSDTFTNYYDWQIVANSSIVTDSNTWFRVTLPFGIASTTGAPNRAAITNVAVLCTDNNTGSTINVNWGSLATVAEASAAAITFRFDDGWATQFTAGKPVLDTYNFKASYFIIPDFVGTTGYMTLSQIQTLRNNGSDICAHHQTDYTTMSVPQLEKVLQNTKDYLYSNGFHRGTDFVAYPNGGFNETIAPTIRKFFKAGLLVTSTGHETMPPGDRYRLRIYNVTSSVAPATLTAAIDTAVTNKEWLILMFHKIVASGATGTVEYNKADLQTVVDYCNTKPIAVKTMSEMLG